MVRPIAQQGHRFCRWEKIRRSVHSSIHIAQRCLNSGPLYSGPQDWGLVRHRKDVFSAAIPKFGFLAGISAIVFIALRWLVPEAGGGAFGPVSVGLRNDPR